MFATPTYKIQIGLYPTEAGSQPNKTNTNTVQTSLILSAIFFVNHKNSFCIELSFYDSLIWRPLLKLNKISAKRMQ